VSAAPATALSDTGAVEQSNSGLAATMPTDADRLRHAADRLADGYGGITTVDPPLDVRNTARWVR
jgi:hypothetical protein